MTDRPIDQLTAVALDAYRERRAGLDVMRARISAVSASAKSPREVVSVTVGPHGELRAIKFPTSAYQRLTPVELASMIMKVVDEAQHEARRKVADLLTPQLPAGVSAEALLAGDIELTTVLPDDPMDS